MTTDQRVHLGLSEVQQRADAISRDLAEAERRHEAVRRARLDLIREMRAADYTWNAIADVLHVTTQRANKLGREHGIR